MKAFDVAVIGGGPGGYVAAARAAQLGLKTALVEKELLGGTCVNWGCIPTKALLRNAEVVHLLTEGKTYGFKCDNMSADYAVAHSRSRQVAKRQGKRVEILLKNRGVEVFSGNARLVGRETVELLFSGEKLQAKNIILATGSSARQIPGMNYDGDAIISARYALQLTKAPAAVVIVGAGPIGMEFATLWKRYGSEVTVVEMLSSILPAEDRDISQEAAAHFQKAGIKIKTGARVESVLKNGAGVEVTVSTGDAEEIISAEKLLVAAGFVPNTIGLGLEEAGARLNRGYVEIDELMRTSIPNIYAIGDITGKLGLAHVASAQGIIAAEAIAGSSPGALVYESIPRCIFGIIEVASAGLTEQQARDRGYEVNAVKSPFVPNGKALAINENSGFIKLIADTKTRKLLGAHMVGPHVTELIAGPAGMIAMGATIEQAALAVYPHPTLSEAVVEGLHALAGHAVHL